MALVLSEAHYDNVRRAVDPTVDLTAIPDEDIASEPYGGRAARTVSRRVPNWESLDADTVQLAVMYLTASYLAEALPVVKQSKLPDQEMIYDTIYRADVAKRLAMLADRVIEELTTVRRTSVLPTFFTIANGTYRR